MIIRIRFSDELNHFMYMVSVDVSRLFSFLLTLSSQIFPLDSKSKQAAQCPCTEGKGHLSCPVPGDSARSGTSLYKSCQQPTSSGAISPSARPPASSLSWQVKQITSVTSNGQYTPQSMLKFITSYS